MDEVTVRERCPTFGTNVDLYNATIPNHPYLYSGSPTCTSIKFKFVSAHILLCPVPRPSCCHKMSLGQVQSLLLCHIPILMDSAPHLHVPRWSAPFNCCHSHLGHFHLCPLNSCRKHLKVPVKTAAISTGAKWIFQLLSKSIVPNR